MALILPFLRRCEHTRASTPHDQDSKVKSGIRGWHQGIICTHSATLDTMLVPSFSVAIQLCKLCHCPSCCKTGDCMHESRLQDLTGLGEFGREVPIRPTASQALRRTWESFKSILFFFKLKLASKPSDARYTQGNAALNLCPEWRLRVPACRMLSAPRS